MLSHYFIRHPAQKEHSKKHGFDADHEGTQGNVETYIRRIQRDLDGLNLRRGEVLYIKINSTC